jgi:hypothetical protein
LGSTPTANSQWEAPPYGEALWRVHMRMYIYSWKRGPGIEYFGLLPVLDGFRLVLGRCWAGLGPVWGWFWPVFGWFCVGFGLILARSRRYLPRVADIPAIFGYVVVRSPATATLTKVLRRRLGSDLRGGGSEIGLPGPTRLSTTHSAEHFRGHGAFRDPLG